MRLGKAIGFFASWLVCAACLGLNSGATICYGKDGLRPNVVLIMADDLGYADVGCYGQQLIKTPNVDLLAQQGLRFTRAYAGGPVCTSSRCVLMTGLHNGHTAARDNVPHYPTYLREEDWTVAETLRAAGYLCGGVGKWSLGDAGTVGRATNQGFDHWFGYLNQDHAHFYFSEYLDDDEGRLELPGNAQTRAHYSHDLLTERALDFIREANLKQQPFFLYAAYTLPHFSSNAEDEDGLTVPTTDPYSEFDWENRAKKYAAMVHRLDRDVGRIVRLVDALGISDRTLIIFTSDNGGHAATPKRFETSGPLRGYKRDLTEGGIRVPFIARWPGQVPANETSQQVIAFQDMLPTFAELAGVQPPQRIDGISVVQALHGKELERQHDFLYWDFGHCRNVYQQAVRLGKWKGIRSTAIGQSPAAIRLYDLDSDESEARDLATQHPEIVSRIEAIMRTEFEPNPRYSVGQLYAGQPIWRPETHNRASSHP